MVPLYVRYMGAEAYGLVGFFAMLQAWFQLLDMGLTPTMARATARFNGGASDALSLRRLLRAMEGIFVGVALLGCTSMVAGSAAIANSWLKVQQLPLIEVQHSIVLMGFIVALRWVCGLYRGAINGFERHVWLSGFNITMATARFVLVIPLFIYIGSSPTEFFSYQLALAIIETVVLVLTTYRLLPKVVAEKRTSWQWAPIRGVLKFSLSIAFTGSVWVMVTQTDKLLLSTMLTLSDYAYYTLAVLVASGVTVISGPIIGAIIPRMARLAAERNEAGLFRLYRNGTQLIAVIAIPAACVLALLSEQVLWVWTGDADLARNAAPTLSLYAMGNGILAIGAFPYYLQFAKGDLKLHLIGSVLFLMLLIPALILTVLNYGVIGAGYTWVAVNCVYFIIWIPLVHRRFQSGLHVQWLIHDLTPIAAGAGFVTFVGSNLLDFQGARLSTLLGILFLSFVSFLASCFAAKCIRDQVFNKFKYF